MLAAGAMAILPFLPIIIAVGAVAIAGYELYKHWKTIWSGIKTVGEDVWHWADDLFHNKITQAILAVVAPGLFLAMHWRQVWTDVRSVALDAWHGIDSGVIHPIEAAASFVVTAVQMLYHGWLAGWNAIGDVIRGIWNNTIQPIVQLIEDAVSKVSSAVGTVSHIAGDIGGAAGKVGGFLGFDDGGFVPGAKGAPMLAIVHGGEYVVSNDMQTGAKPIDNRIMHSGFATAGAPSGGGMTPLPVAGTGRSGDQAPIVLQVKLYLDGREIAAAMETEMLRNGQRRGDAYQQVRK